MPAAINLNPHIEQILELIIDGVTYREIASKYKVSVGKLHSFLNTSEHSARAKHAFELSAASYYDLAEETIKQAEPTMPEMQRARMLSELYTKKAGKRNPKEYGDRIEHAGGLDMAITWIEQAPPTE